MSYKVFSTVPLTVGVYLLVALCPRRMFGVISALRIRPCPDPSADARRSWAVLAAAAGAGAAVGAGCRASRGCRSSVVGRGLPTADWRLPVPNAVIKSVELWPRWLPAKWATRCCDAADTEGDGKGEAEAEAEREAEGEGEGGEGGCCGCSFRGAIAFDLVCWAMGSTRRPPASVAGSVAVSASATAAVCRVS